MNLISERPEGRSRDDLFAVKKLERICVILTAPMIVELNLLASLSPPLMPKVELLIARKHTFVQRHNCL
jgi:hypothetical protein